MNNQVKQTTSQDQANVNQDYQSLEIQRQESSFNYRQETNEVRVGKIRKNMKKLGIAIFICLIFMTAEVIGGYMAQSLAIMTDAAHLLSDVLGYVISIFSLWLSLRTADKDLTYGYARADVLGAMGSVAIIWGLTGWLLYEAYERLINQDYEIDAQIMFITACFGLICNLIMAKVISPEEIAEESKPQLQNNKELEQNLLNDQKETSKKAQEKSKESQNVNMKAAAIHILGDIIQSIGVIAASVIIYFQPTWKIADPICTILFAVIVISTTFGIVKDCIKVIMEGLPNDFELQQFESDLNRLNGVEEVINLHIWQISLGKLSLSCRIKTRRPTSETLLSATKLCFKYGIFHPTIQVEDLNQDNELLNELLEHNFH